MAIAAVTCVPDVAEQTSLMLMRLDQKLSLCLRFLARSLASYHVRSEGREQNSENCDFQRFWGDVSICSSFVDWP